MVRAVYYGKIGALPSNQKANVSNGKDEDYLR